MANPEDILAFWLDEIGPKGWYDGSAALDAQIRERFETDWSRAMQGCCAAWLTHAHGALAYIILTDQFPRNMFRGSGRAFSSDAIALAAAKQSIARGYDMRIEEPARQFFYMPLMHSENLTDQDRCVRLMKTRLPQTGQANLKHAKAHREVIRKFGRFPYRNEALDRSTTGPEAAFEDQGGYRRALEITASA